MMSVTKDFHMTTFAEPVKMSVTKDFHMTTFAEPVKQSDTISSNYWVNSNLQNYITTQINEYLLHQYLP